MKSFYSLISLLILLWIPYGGGILQAQDQVPGAILGTSNGQAALVINEIDYVQPGPGFYDLAEFIELKNIGEVPISLRGYSLVFDDNRFGIFPITVSLQPRIVAPGDYYVICIQEGFSGPRPAVVPNCDTIYTEFLGQFAFPFLPNGPGAIKLLDGLGKVADQVSFEAVVPGYVETAPAVGEHPNRENVGISRYPDGQDTNDNSVDFVASCTTPGEPNTLSLDNCSGCAIAADFFGVGECEDGKITVEVDYTATNNDSPFLLVNADTEAVLDESDFDPVFDPNLVAEIPVPQNKTLRLQVVDKNNLGCRSAILELDVTDCFGPACEPNFVKAGTLRAGNTPGCLNGHEVFLKVREATPPTVPVGYTKLFVLTQGPELMIQKTSTQPVFGVRDPGYYTVHTLVYDPSSVNLGNFVGKPAADLLAYFQAEGICADLDVEGFAFNLKRCGDCEADAGTLKMTNDPGCYDGAREVFLKAEHVGEPIVPTGFELIYVLTMGVNVVIQDTHTQPLFGVNAAGRYAIHAFVYDPATFDPSIIQLGQTTGGEVVSIINDGNICADWDVTGAVFNIEVCPGDPGSEGCPADAGTLRAGNTPGCLNGQEVFLKVRDARPPTIPAGYRRVYVLTVGTELMIQRLSDRAVFGVRQASFYTIHSLVYNSNSLTPSDFTGQPVESLLMYIQSNEICASLDAAGYSFDIQPCATAQSQMQGMNNFSGDSPPWDFRLYPNPSKRELFLEFAHMESGLYDIQLLAQDMKLVRHSQVWDSTERIQLEVKGLSEGFYFLIIRGPQGQMITEKVLIKR